MTTDTERNYTGTNFAVITLVVLVAMAIVYAIVAQINDVADDKALYTQQSVF